MTALTFVVLATAAYRAARAVALDSITEGFRQSIEDWALGGPTWKEKIAELVTCGFCVSFWTAGITYFVYMVVTTDGPVPGNPLLHLIYWWAIAGLAALFIAVDSFLLREAPPS